jgi:hypothetical protein
MPSKNDKSIDKGGCIPQLRVRRMHGISSGGTHFGIEDEAGGGGGGWKNALKRNRRGEQAWARGSRSEAGHRGQRNRACWNKPAAAGATVFV